MGTPWDFAFDSNEDMHLDSNYQLAVTETFEALVAARIRARLRTVLGEHFLNRELGVPYFEEVLVKNPDTNRVNNLLISEMVAVPGVQKVLEFDSTFDRASRVFNIRFKVLVTTGAVVEGTV